MPAYLRALATDLDGTLTDRGTVSARTLAALDRARATGLRIVLVTGRILTELDASFPDLRRHVDATVAENGAVLAMPSGSRRLTQAVPSALVRRLRRSGIDCRSGEVLVAAHADDEMLIVDAIRQEGLDCALVRNRSELMVLPAGVTKATGLHAALAELGLSPHNTIAVGDAENDHALFDACEIGAAVANAVPSLKAHADLVLDGVAGDGVTELLDGDVVSGRRLVHPSRWSIELGHDSEGEPVRIPSSQLNVLVSGASGTGKSYLAGLMVEQLIRSGYTVVVIDPEGDHRGLLELPLVWTTDGALGPSSPSAVARLLQADHSLIVDLSPLDPALQEDYTRRLPAEIQAQRSRSGRPQWVVVDEAHSSLHAGGTGQQAFETSFKGLLVVTWQPAGLATDTVAGLDVIVAAGGARPPAGLVDILAAVGDLRRTTVADALRRATGRAVLVRRDRPRTLTVFTPATRATPHVRHEHKYELTGLSRAERFHFCRADGRPTGASAGDLDELEAQLSTCDREVLRHHSPRHDFSRWLRQTLGHPSTAAAFADIEANVTARSPDAAVEAARLSLISAVQEQRPAISGR